MRKFHNKGNRGFTLVELLVVVAIIAILAAIALPQFSRYRQSAMRNAVRSDIRNAVSAVEAFVASYSVYPDNVTCGPGPTQCDLTGSDGTNTYTETGALNVSRDVTIQYTRQTCATGAQGYTITGTHAQITGFTASYDSCTGQYQGF